MGGLGFALACLAPAVVSPPTPPSALNALAPGVCCRTWESGPSSRERSSVQRSAEVWPRQSEASPSKGSEPGLRRSFYACLGIAQLHIGIETVLFCSGMDGNACLMSWAIGQG